MPVAVPKIDYYAVLELEKDATEEDIRVAYKKLALKWHPDRHQDHKDEAQEKFIKIKDAYLHLLDDCRRKNKHKGRKAKPPPPPKSESSSSTYTTSSTTSSSSGTSAPSDHPHEDHERPKHCTKEKTRRPPDPPPAKKPSKLSKQPPLRPDRHRRGSFSHLRSHRDDSSDEEDRPHKRHHPTHHHDTPEDTDFEFVDPVDLGTPLPPLRSPKHRGKNLSSESRDWVFALPLTLEELYRGGSQHYRITRALRSGKTQSVKIDVRVSPSWRHGTEIRVPGVGNEHEDGTFQDIVFVVEEEPHPDYTREGNDLYVSVQVPWVENRPYSTASDCTEDGAPAPVEDHVYIKALNGNEYALPIPRSLAAVAGGSRVVGAGMPIRKHGKHLGEGDLIVKWDFIFTEAEKGQRLRWNDLKKVMHWKL